jgi:dTMP kinase
VTAAAARRGRFITFEGGEGAGKSTQIGLLAERLRRAGHDVTTTREPGGSAGAEVMRHLLLSGVGQLLGPEGESLLFAAARADHVAHLIGPALASGRWVLCDRFTDSSRTYQGRIGGVDRRLLDAMQRVTIGDLKPDLTIILDIPAELGMERAARRRGSAHPDRFEAEDAVFHRRLRRAYREIATREPRRCVLIDATDNVEGVASAVWSAVVERLGQSDDSGASATA